MKKKIEKKIEIFRNVIVDISFQSFIISLIPLQPKTWSLQVSLFVLLFELQLYY
jgi:hypothetical protein